MSHLTEITTKWLRDSYTLDAKDEWKYRDALEGFYSFVNMTDKQFVESYKKSSDKTEWAKEYGQKVVAFYKPIEDEIKSLCANSEKWVSCPRFVAMEKLSK